MIGRDVEKHADARPERRRQVDLERRHLDHVDAVRGRRLERQDRGADIAAHLNVAARLAQDMGDERRGGRLAVRARDGDEGGFRREPVPLAAEQLDIADDRNAGRARQARRPMRLGMGQRHAGREHERGEARPIGLPEIACADALGPRRFQAGGAVVAGDDLCAARLQRQRRHEARTAEPEQRDRLAGEGGDRRHRLTAA